MTPEIPILNILESDEEKQEKLAILIVGEPGNLAIQMRDQRVKRIKSDRSDNVEATGVDLGPIKKRKQSRSRVDPRVKEGFLDAAVMDFTQQVSLLDSKANRKANRLCNSK